MTAIKPPVALVRAPAHSPFRLGSMFVRINRWYDRHLQYAALAELDDDMLRDIGLEPEDVRRARARQFR